MFPRVFNTTHIAYSFSRLFCGARSEYIVRSYSQVKTFQFNEELVQKENSNVAFFDGLFPIKQLNFKYNKASSPGGSYANAVRSKVAVSFHVDSAKFLNDKTKKLVLKHAYSHINKKGEFQVTSQTGRSRILNQADCLQKIRQIIWHCIETDKESIASLEKQQARKEEAIKQLVRIKPREIMEKNRRSFNHRMKQVQV